MMKLSIVTVLCGLIVASAAFDYEGYKIYDITPRNEFEREIIFEFSKNNEFDFFSLKKLLNVPARVMVPPKYQDDFEKSLSRNNMEYTVINENVAKSIEKERMENQLMRSLSQKVGFTKFHRFDEINGYLDELANKYSNRVTVKTVGKSYEGRTMKTITITNGDGRANKKVIFIDAGIHAREWVAPPAALYIINQLVEHFDQNKGLLLNYDWVILPVVNPDGYEYTHTNTRMWRKTRKPSSSTCYGTDGNRNFDYSWGTVGASNNPCDDTFRGSAAFSEPETQAVRDVLKSLSGRGKLYITFHSYGNYLLHPWGWTSDLPQTWKDMDEVLRAGADAMKAASGGKYTVGSSTNVLYAAAGGSDDYAYGVAKFPISLTWELPSGGSGFNPPPSKIQPIVQETWAGVKAMAQKVMQKY